MTKEKRSASKVAVQLDTTIIDAAIVCALSTDTGPRLFAIASFLTIKGGSPRLRTCSSPSFSRCYHSHGHTTAISSTIRAMYHDETGTCCLLNIHHL